MVLFFFRSSNDGLKTDVLLKFQFVSNNADTTKRQADNILHQKLKLNESFLKIDTSLPHLRGKKYFPSLVRVYHLSNISTTEKALFHHKRKPLFIFKSLLYLIINKSPHNGYQYYLPLVGIEIIMKRKPYDKPNIIF